MNKHHTLCKLQSVILLFPVLLVSQAVLVILQNPVSPLYGNAGNKGAEVCVVGRREAYILELPVNLLSVVFRFSIDDLSKETV